MDPDKWSWPARGVLEGPPVNYGSIRFQISASEAARFGHLFLNRGEWDGEQLISTKWVDQATSVQVPASPPAYPNRYDPSGEGPGVYGYNWWVNGIGPNGSREYPGATPGTYAAWGHGNNLIFVIPEWDMVVVRLATGEAPITPEATYLTGLDCGAFLSRIGSALVPDSGALSVQMPAMQLYTVVDDDTDGTIDGRGDTAQDVADLPRRPVGEIDDATANRLIRLGTNFHLPNVSNPAKG